MYTVWKYPLEMKDYQTIDVPRDACALSAIEQNGSIVLYCCHDRSDEQAAHASDTLEVLVMGTGHNTVRDIYTFDFVGTVVMRPLGLVFHVHTRLLR